MSQFFLSATDADILTRLNKLYTGAAVLQTRVLDGFDTIGVSEAAGLYSGIWSFPEAGTVGEFEIYLEGYRSSTSIAWRIGGAGLIQDESNYLKTIPYNQSALLTSEYFASSRSNIAFDGSAHAGSDTVPTKIRYRIEGTGTAKTLKTRAWQGSTEPTVWNFEQAYTANHATGLVGFFFHDPADGFITAGIGTNGDAAPTAPVGGGGTDALNADDLQSTSSVTSPAINQEHAILADDNSSNSTVSQPALGQEHSLLSDGNESASTVSSPALTSSAATDNLLADDLQTSSEVSTPSIGQVHAFAGQDLNSASEVGSPSIGQTHSITADNNESASEVSSPAINQVHDLFAVSVTSNSQVSTPSITATDSVDNLLANGVESQSELSSPAIGQVHDLLAKSIESKSTVGFFGGFPTINGVPYLEGGRHPVVQTRVRLFLGGNL